MARTQRYKNIERTLWARVLQGLKAAGRAIARTLRAAGQAATLRLTVVIVPHSDGRQISLETNVAALVLGFVLVLGVSASGVYVVHGAAEDKVEVARLTQKGRDTQASLDELRDANIDLLETAKKFQKTLTTSISLLGTNDSSSGLREKGENGGSGDLASLFKEKNTKDEAYSVQETQEVKALTEFLDNATSPVEQFGKMFDSRAVLFREIPSIWPVTNPNAHLSMAFGPNVHPITGQWYIHKGLDFSTFRSGDRVVATADGYVAMVGYDLSFGNYVIIKHKHGIYTRYAHMMYSTVKKGQYVNQKDLIGYVGNTGVTTGPHLHYEVHIGSDVVDPARYINVKLFK